MACKFSLTNANPIKKFKHYVRITLIIVIVLKLQNNIVTIFFLTKVLIFLFILTTYSKDLQIHFTNANYKLPRRKKETKFKIQID